MSEGGTTGRFLARISTRLRAGSDARKARALHRAVAERHRREHQDGSIWRSGKGGAHHDR